MSGYETRAAVRRAIRELVLQAGGQMVTRPMVRSEPDGAATHEPEPEAGITAAVAVEREARRQCLDSIRYAREDGLGWPQAGLALGFTGGYPDPAVQAYAYAVPARAAADWFGWTCPSCGENIRDYGPGLPPDEAEKGHGEGCERFAATVAAWERQWDDGSEEESPGG